MSKSLRAVVAITICLSGWALLPLASLPSQAFGWELWAEAYGEIFSDGLETGDTSRWSGGTGQFQNFLANDSSDFTMTFRIKAAGWNSDPHRVITLVTGMSDKDVPVFKVEGRRRGRLFELRGRALSEPNVWVETPWRTIEEHYGTIEIEWRRAMEATEDGLLYVSVDDDLALWLVDLDNSPLPLRIVQLPFLGNHPVASTLRATFRPVDSRRNRRK